MSLPFLKETPVTAFRKLERDLRVVNPKLDLRRYKAMTPRRLGEEIGKLDNLSRDIPLREEYGIWLHDEKFVEMKLLQDALSQLRAYKIDRQKNEVMVPGFTYYKSVKQFGNNLVGRKCYFTESGPVEWASFETPIAVAKAFEVMKHGNAEDFQNIYVDMANGRIDALNKTTLEHVSKSSPEALQAIEEYCDHCWEGAWPWEESSPYKLRSKIEENREMRNHVIEQMQGRFNNLLVKLQEQEMDQFDMLTIANDMLKVVDNMIGDVGKLSSTGIEAVAQARTSAGDDIADSLQQAMQGPMNDVITALTSFKASIQQSIHQIQGPGGPIGGGLETEVGGMNGMNGMNGMGDDTLGTPADALGGGVDGVIPGDLGDGSDELADVGLGDGGDSERPMKEL